MTSKECCRTNLNKWTIMLRQKTNSTNSTWFYFSFCFAHIFLISGTEQFRTLTGAVAAATATAAAVANTAKNKSYKKRTSSLWIFSLGSVNELVVKERVSELEILCCCSAFVHFHAHCIGRYQCCRLTDELLRRPAFHLFYANRNAVETWMV